MRICLLTGEYPALGAHGGIGTYTQNLAHGLAGRGHAVTVLARAFAPTAPFQEGTVQIEPVLAPRRWRLPVGNRYVGMSTWTLPFIHEAARRFQALQAEAPFDVVEVPEYQGWGLGVLAKARCPVVVRLHSHTALVRRLNDVPLDLDARLVGALEAMSIRRGDVVLSNSKALAEAMAQDFGADPERVGVLPLGIDADRFRPGDAGWLRAELGLPESAPLLLYVGRLERRKGVEPMIEAFARVAGWFPEATLAMAGFSTDTGPKQQSLLTHLQGRLDALGLSERVRFLGHVPYEQLPAYYAGADICLAPSLYEPFGMIYLEAMACGRPVVGTAAGGAVEILKHGENGLLVPPGEAEPLAVAIADLIADAPRRARLGENARRTVLTHFSLPVFAERTEAHYRAAIEASRSHSGSFKEVGYVPHP